MNGEGGVDAGMHTWWELVTWLEQNATYWGEDQKCVGSSSLEIPGDLQ